MSAKRKGNRRNRTAGRNRASAPALPTSPQSTPEPNPPFDQAFDPELDPELDPAFDPKVPETTANYREIEISDLTFKQQHALPFLAVSRSVAQASRDSGVTEKTLRKWLDNPAFRSELDNLRKESYDISQKQLQALVPHFIAVLAREALENPDPAIRIRAARYGMNYALGFRDFDKVTSELDDLRAALRDGK